VDDSFYNILISNERNVAILVDPDKKNETEDLIPLVERINLLSPSAIFIGGSTVNSQDFKHCITKVRELTSTPIVLFPGSHLQIDDQADSILFLSLISGRNPDFLIGHQVEAAHILKKMDLEVIPTGYMLIDGGKTSAVSYVSQTTPIPSDQTVIAVKTAIAGEMLGLKAIFMDAGSGAKKSIPTQLISDVKESISIPLIVGGGIRTIDEIDAAFNSGANLVVIGNKIEENIDFLLDIKNSIKKTNK